MVLTTIREAAEHFPGHIAVQMKIGDAYRKIAYPELLAMVASTAQSLFDLGIKPGERLALLSENRPEWIVAYLATMSIGAVIVPLDAQLTEKEVSLLMENSGATGVFVSSQTRTKIAATKPLLIISFDDGEGKSFSHMMTGNRDAKLPPPVSAQQLAALIYTSGTTGDPKGVMLTQGNLASDCASCIKINLIRTDDNMLCILPYHHTYPAMACLILPLSLGATITLLNSLKGPDILACMKETNVTIMVAVPQLYAALRRALFDAIDKKPAPVRLLVKLLLAVNGLSIAVFKKNLGKSLFGKAHETFGPSLRFFASGGARLDAEVYTDMTRLGFTMVEGYGMTETSPVSTFNLMNGQRAGSIGKQLPGVEVRIANPDEHGHGELAIRGPNVMLGYYNKPEETAEVLRDGWLYTGDLGYRDREGYFFITGRSKEMIVLATGKKIFPDELETYYKQIPSIKEICILQGERGLEAAVVPNFEYLKKMNLSNSRETIAFSIEDLAKDLPPYKRIGGLKIFRDPLPVTRLGKLRRAKVRQLYDASSEQTERALSDHDAELMADPVMDKLRACLAPFTKKKQITPEDNLELDLGLDSLARVELVVSIEQSFGVSLPETFGSEVFTVKDTMLKIKNLLSAEQPAENRNVTMTWSHILSEEPAQDIAARLSVEQGPAARAGRYALRLLLKAILLPISRLEVKGAENLPDQGPYIIAPNHLSFVDAPAVAAALPWRIAARTFSLGTTDYFGGPVTSKIARLINVIPVNMDARLYSAMQLSAMALRRGKVLLVFPEGSRSRDGAIKEFKKGVAIVAREMNAPIIPTALHGTYEMLPPGRILLRPTKITVTFGKPLLPDGRDYDELTRALYNEVVGLLEQRP
jgi:long-chain acyl-CoA synthetase